MFCNTCGKLLEQDIAGSCPECLKKKQITKSPDENKSTSSLLKANFRLVALIIDAFVVLVFVHLTSEALSYISFPFEKLFLGAGFYFFFFTLLWFCYSLVSEILFATTIGKYSMGGYVIVVNGSSLTFSMVLQRNLRKFWILLLLSMVNLVATYLLGFPALARGTGILASTFTSLSVILQILLLFLLIIRWMEICYNSADGNSSDQTSQTVVIRENINGEMNWLRVMLPLMVFLVLATLDGLLILLNEKADLEIIPTPQSPRELIQEPSEQIKEEKTAVSDLPKETSSDSSQQSQNSSASSAPSQLEEIAVVRENPQIIEANKLLAELKTNVFYSEQLSIILKLKKMAVCHPELIDGITPYLFSEKEELVSITLDILKPCNTLPETLKVKLRTLSSQPNPLVKNKAEELLKAKYAN